MAIPRFQVVLTQEFLVHPEGPQVPGILPPFTLCLLAYFLSPLYLSCPSLAPQASPYFSQPTLPPIRLPWLPSPMRQCPCLLGLAFRHDSHPPSQLPNLNAPTTRNHKEGATYTYQLFCAPRPSHTPGTILGYTPLFWFTWQNAHKPSNFSSGSLLSSHHDFLIDACPAFLPCPRPRPTMALITLIPREPAASGTITVPPTPGTQ